MSNSGQDSVLTNYFTFSYSADGQLIARQQSGLISDKQEINWDSQGRIASWFRVRNASKDSTFYAYLGTSDLVDTFIAKYWYMGQRPSTLGYLNYDSLQRVTNVIYYTNGGPQSGPPTSLNYFYNQEGLIDSFQYVSFVFALGGFQTQNQYFTYYSNDSTKTKLRVTGDQDTIDMIRYGYEPSLRIDSIFYNTFDQRFAIDSILYNADGFPETYIYYSLGSGQPTIKTVAYRPGCKCPLEINEYKANLSRRWRYFYSGNCANIIIDPAPADPPILVYPNPTNGILRSTLDEQQLKAEALFSVDGKQIIAFNPPKELSLGIHLEGVPVGVYLLKTRNSDGKVFTFRVVVE